jgi:hypothetical protein
MRRMLVSLMTAAVGIGLWATPASAGGTITYRNDPDDTPNVLDIRSVGTDQIRSGGRFVYLEVGTWDLFQEGDLNVQNDNYFVSLFDTQRRARFDFVVFLFYNPPDGTFYCDAWTRNQTHIGSREAFVVGPDGARGVSGSSISCVFPRVWLEIEKPPRFAVESWYSNVFRDRAPNPGQGKYQGL